MNFGSHLTIDIESESMQHLAPGGKTERFEGIGFSSTGLMAIATSETNSVLLFRPRLNGSYESSPYCRIGGADGLKYPHDVSFAQFERIELLAVAQRGGAIALYVRYGNDEGFGSEPVFEIRGPETKLAFSDGVAFVPPNNDGLAVCNLERGTVTFYRMASLSPVRFETAPVFELGHRSINNPDGLGFSRRGRWLAVANHGNHTVSIFERSRGGGFRYGPEPVSVIRDRKLRYPHSVIFTPRRHVVVSNAGANYFSAYRPTRRGRHIRWAKGGVSRTIAGNDMVFRDINAQNKMEGGPKGIAIYKDILAICSPEFGVKLYRFREKREPSWPF